MLTAVEVKKAADGPGHAAVGPQAPVYVLTGDASGVRSASSPTPNVARRGSLAQSLPPIDRSATRDEDMAWSLVDAVKSRLTGYERTIVFVELGCGETYLVIKRILTALLSNPMTLPVAVFAKLTGWLDGYAGSPEEPQLRTMLTAIRLQQLEAV
ncbi:hypothetical protein [Mycobacterium alsense]|uniref:hypothetical protein n=1 Tax=Mycobacterium alsense TaxID=324058 RepID=UPI001FD35C6C|nr:hypothetical protein [Mycobacterium alsense]